MDSRDPRRSPRIPRNEAGALLAQQIASCQCERVRLVEERSSRSAHRSRAAIEETRLRKAEDKVVRECRAVRQWERNAAYEQSKRMRTKPTPHMADAMYERRQVLLSQMLIDDRLHPRCSHPTPIQLPEILERIRREK
jgi:hypothetical protein